MRGKRQRSVGLLQVCFGCVRKGRLCNNIVRAIQISCLSRFDLGSFSDSKRDNFCCCLNTIDYALLMPPAFLPLLVPRRLIGRAHLAGGPAGPESSLSAGHGAPAPLRRDRSGLSADASLPSLISKWLSPHLWPGVTKHYSETVALISQPWAAVTISRLRISYKMKSEQNHPTCNSPSRILRRNSKSSQDKSSRERLPLQSSLLPCMFRGSDLGLMYRIEGVSVLYFFCII